MDERRDFHILFLLQQAKLKRELAEQQMAKRKSERETDDVRPAKFPPDIDVFLLDTRVVRPTTGFAFFENSYLRGLYELLHTNVIFNWLSGDYGPIDDPLITRDKISMIWRELPQNGFFLARYITNYYVDQEWDFWLRVFKEKQLERGWLKITTTDNGHETYTGRW